jgi:hypothetical protein
VEAAGVSGETAVRDTGSHAPEVVSLWGSRDEKEVAMVPMAAAVAAALGIAPAVVVLGTVAAAMGVELVLVGLVIAEAVIVEAVRVHMKLLGIACEAVRRLEQAGPW